jgi:DNA-directed RNA polymerase subunit RPC12/RpoP
MRPNAKRLAEWKLPLRENFMIRLKCGKCAKILNLDDAKAGKVVACPCGQKLRVPMPKGTAKAPAGKAGSAKKPDAKSAGKPAKIVHEDDDFNPYTMQPLAEPPPPIEINRGSAEEDDEDDGKRKKKKGSRSPIRMIVLFLLLAVLGVVAAIYFMQSKGGAEP